jgi:uncharacterized protein (DUF697 family)
MDKDTHLSDTIDELEIDLTTVASTIRKTEAQNVVKNNIITSMASGLIPIPLVDILSLSNIQFHMIQTLAEHYETPTDKIKKSLITSFISGSLPVVSILGLGSIIKSMPGIGSLAGSGSVSMASGAVTYAVGQVFIRHFELGGTLQDFNPDSAKDFFREELKTGKEVARALIREIKQQNYDKIATNE